MILVLIRPSVHVSVVFGFPLERISPVPRLITEVGLQVPRRVAGGVSLWDALFGIKHDYLRAKKVLLKL